MDEHRRVVAKKVGQCLLVDQPFSCFKYVDRSYPSGNAAIRRLFSLARSGDAHTLMVEEIEPTGILLVENDEIKDSCDDYKDYTMAGLERISFWKSKFTEPSPAVCNNDACIGYAILKRDVIPSQQYDRWHVFEAVFTKYQHEHNCVPTPMKYSVSLGGQTIQIQGLLYAQQNGLNKACAQVALRSLLSKITHKDVSYKEINDIARQGSVDFKPADGLDAEQIHDVLKAFKIQFRDHDYSEDNASERRRHPYQKYVYGGIESGMGALVGFRLSRARRRERRHIIPLYGHTFNKDTWAPEADVAYFPVSKSLGYVPSENWTSSFLGHDDNFGPNFCIPRLYINQRQVDYVAELLRPKMQFGGAQAEALALQYLYSVFPYIDVSKNVWLGRLAQSYKRQRIVLRAISVDSNTYIKHLSSETDWDGNTEYRRMIDILHKDLPHNLWIVEISIPQLFPANQRKLGDIVLNGEIELSDTSESHAQFVLARLPGKYFFVRDKHAKPDFLTARSRLKSHVSVLTLDESTYKIV